VRTPGAVAPVVPRPEPPPAAAGRVPRIRLEGVGKTFHGSGGPYPAIGHVDLAVEAGAFVAIVGPSGCGKSTLLRLVAGLDRPTAGRITLDGRPVTGVSPTVGIMFQQDALLPWRTVLENVALGPRIRGVSRPERLRRARAWIERVGLGGFEARYPAQLSGGMRQRAALAQVLACEPEILLMDEPFAHLDAQTRRILEADLLALCAGGSRTVLLVTHDLDEAVAMADAVALMTAGPASRIRAVHRVGLPRPRDLNRVRSEPAFTHLSRLLWEHLWEEVGRGRER